MSITTTDSTKQALSHSVGPVKFQYVDFVANSGETSGTVTADRLKEVYHIMLPDGSIKYSAAPTYATNVGTFAFTVPAETASSLVVQDLTYTAVANLGAGGDAITIDYDAGGTAGAELVTVTGTAILVKIDVTPVTGSSATQVAAAVTASSAASALVTVAVTGTGATVQAATSATPLAGGVTGGARGTALCIGR